MFKRLIQLKFEHAYFFMSYLSKVIVLLSVVMLLLGLNSAEAQSQTTTVGNGWAGSCTDAALRSAIANGGEIRFHCGNGPVTIGLSRALMISADTIIDGGNTITLSGNWSSGILASDQHLSLTLRNITLANGHTSGQGGALNLGYWNTLTVDNVRFINNRAYENDSACDGGGAIFIGGGSTATITNSHFENNRANNGGAINNLRSGLTVTDSTFHNNHATHTDNINRFGDCGGGGAIYIDATRKPADGGPDKITLIGNRYTNNSTNNHGGAIFVAVHNGEKVEIGASYFEGNRVTKAASMATSGTGGAIWYGKAAASATNNYLTLYNSAFINNHADTQGGGLWTSLPATISNSTFHANTAINPATLDKDDWRKGNGGAIAVAHQAQLIIESSTIAGNRAGFNGGGVVGQNIAARNSIIADNLGDWHLGLQQNCTHALQNWGGNLQFLASHSEPDHRHWSGCGKTITQANPLLGRISNGVLPLQANSPALDAAVGGCPATDQRGIARPQGPACDIGAFERQQWQ